MNELGLTSQLIIPLGGVNLVFNLETMVMTWMIIIVLLFFGYMATRKRKLVPGRIQAVGELLVGAIYGLTYDTLDEKLARKYAPMVATLFMFLVLCNWWGIIPGFHEPTKDLNLPLALGLMSFFISHAVGIKSKGIVNYIKGYMDPIFLMAPINIIGELSKVVSMSFRIFGNIMGGSIIIMVVSHLCLSLVLPPFLNAFFGLFVGTIQAFVFTMLTIVYISVQVE